VNFKVAKLDKRHAWRELFPYMIEFRRRKDRDHKSTDGVLEFDQCRKWFNECWGWSQDVETQDKMLTTMSEAGHPNDINKFWSYSIRYGEYRIYVSDQVLTMFELRWRQHEPARS
jgi:hypothetical protein